MNDQEKNHIFVRKLEKMKLLASGMDLTISQG